MRAIWSLLAVLATSWPIPSGADAPAAPAASLVSDDLCTTPANWSPPFTHVYHLKTGTTLVFVGVEHGSDLADASHQAIKAAIDRYRPGLVLVEGVSATKSAFDWYRQRVSEDAETRVKAGSAPETLFAAWLARQSGARFAGWDFSPDQDYQLMVEEKFALADVLGAHLLRSHIDPFDDARSASENARQLRYAAAVQPIASFDYAAWYRAAYGDRFDPREGTPCGKGIASRIVRRLSYRRTLNLAELIERAATPNTTILVEAGANHWLALSAWLRARGEQVS